MVEPALERPDEMKTTMTWCQILDMYRAWGRKRHMQLTEVDADFLRGDPRLPMLLVMGFGAHRPRANVSAT